MATTAFICNVEDSVDSHQIKQRVRSYTLLQVLVGVLVVLVLVVTGGFIWMMGSQNCSVRVWTVKFNGTDTNFTSPESKKYVIFGMVFTKENSTYINSFKLVRKLPKQNHSDIHKADKASQEIARRKITEGFEVNAELEKGTGLSILLNLNDMKIDEEKSFLVVYEKIF